MSDWHFKGIYSDGHWQETVTVTTDPLGIITDIKPIPDEQHAQIDGFLIPGFQNAHSHAFQFELAGLTEFLAPDRIEDDFWSWRNQMYALANSITPEQMLDIAKRLYQTLLCHGYTQVVEFHYVHHDNQGRPFQNRAEMAIALMEAAVQTGIQLQLIPIFYQQANFNTAAIPQQQRFISQSLEDYQHLLAAIQHASKNYAFVTCGIGVHSLRTVAIDNVVHLLRELPKDIPFHLHIAEQQREVDDCQLALGTTPVAWLLDNAEIDARHHLVHATHMTADETTRLAKTQARVVLCPSTEGNLGDGFFPLVEYMQQGGQWGIGTDSHVGLSPLEELRWLDYGARLNKQKRNVICNPKTKHSGDVLFRHATQPLAIGTPLTGIVIANKYFEQLAPASRLDKLIYTGNHTWISQVLVHGKLIKACH